MQGLRRGDGERSPGPRDARLRRGGLPQGDRRGTLLPRCAGRRSYGPDHGCSVRLYRQSRLRLATFLRKESNPMPNDTLLLGAVAYDPKVVMIWDGFQAYFEKRGLNFDYILYSNYERQVAAQFAGLI